VQGVEGDPKNRRLLSIASQERANSPPSETEFERACSRGKHARGTLTNFGREKKSKNLNIDSKYGLSKSKEEGKGALFKGRWTYLKD